MGDSSHDQVTPQEAVQRLISEFSTIDSGKLLPSDMENLRLKAGLVAEGLLRAGVETTNDQAMKAAYESAVYLKEHLENNTIGGEGSREIEFNVNRIKTSLSEIKF